MPGTDQFEGTVTELERSTTSEGVILSFWLVSKTGARALVALHRDEQLKNGDFVSVTGARDSQSTLIASSISIPAAIGKAPAVPIQWGRVVLSAFISSLICTVVYLYIFYYLVNRPVTSLRGGIELFWDLLVLLAWWVVAYLPLISVCSLILTVSLVSYRRLTHGLWSVVISLPMSWVMLTLWMMLGVFSNPS